MNISIHHSETICNSLKENNLYEILSEAEQNHVPSVLLAMFSPNYHGKTVDLEQYSDYHRTSISRFEADRIQEFSSLWSIMAISRRNRKYKSVFNRSTYKMYLRCQPLFERPILCFPFDFLASAASGCTLMLVLSRHNTSVFVSMIPWFCISSNIL